jgi:hypothetical protein
LTNWILEEKCENDHLQRFSNKRSFDLKNKIAAVPGYIAVSPGPGGPAS